MRNTSKKCLSVFTALCTVAASVAFPGGAVKAAYTESDAAFISFSDTGAAWEKGTETGYTIDGTAVTVTDPGTYVFSGSCADGSITVKKGTTDVVLVLNGLELTSATTAPILCKTTTGTEIVAEAGTVNTITDAEANTEEKAAIKVNKQSSLTLSGTGTLNVNGMCKNGVKGGAETDITVKEQNLNITAVDNGLASDNSVTIKSGKLSIEAGGDGIKSSPDTDEGDTVSLGDIIIEDGEIEITAVADGIQGDRNVTISGGNFDITANGGYTTTLAEDADSCKGIKAVDTLTISDGTFTINSADDAVHSNQYISVLGGKFTIRTGDDGMHADTSLIVGTEGESAGPEISVENCYEGLEAGNVYVYSGNVEVNSTDDGINAGGGDGSGNAGGGPGGDGFNPGGGMPGGPGGRAAENNADAAQTTEASEYAIYINGGNVYVKAAGDGLDANGGIYINGGNTVVYGAAAGAQGSDNFPFDHDVSFVINGGYVFGAGSSQMEESVSSAAQEYIISRNTYNQGTVVNVVDSQGEALFSTTMEERVNYMLYSSPEMTSSESYSVKTGTIEVKTNVKKCEITLKQDSYTYDGTAKEPAVTVTYEGKTLTQGLDYTISYKNNTDAGTAVVTVTGIGSYTGEDTREFTIQKAEWELQLPYTRITKTYGDAAFQLNINADGTLSYISSNPAAVSVSNTGLVTIKGTGKAVLTVTAQDGNHVAKAGNITVYVKPSQTTGVKSKAASTSKINLAWQKVTGASGYRVYRYDSSSKAWKCVKTITSGNTTSYTDGSLSAGTTYKYKVCAYVTIDQGKYSGAASAVVSSATKPVKSSIKSVSAKKKSVTLKWKKTVGSGYEICYSTKKDFSGGTKTVKVSGTSKTTAVIRNLKSKKTYYVKIRAYKKVGKEVVYGNYSSVKKVKTK